MKEAPHSSRELLAYSEWCARLANECPVAFVADELRQLSRELILKAQEEAVLKESAA